MRSASTRRTVALAALAAAATFALTACAAGGTPSPSATPPQTITVTHAQGSTDVPRSPKRVVTFDMATLDTLDALGIPVAGLPESSVPGYLKKYADTTKYTDVGTLFEPDYEVVNELAPDLIVVANRSAKALPELDKIAPTIDLTLDWTDYLDSFSDNVDTLARIFGAEQLANAKLDAIHAKVTATRTRAEKIGGSGLVIMTSGGQITAFGPGSRFGWIHDALGVKPAIEDVEAATHGDPVSSEFVLQTDPDRLFVIDRDAATGDGGQAAEQVLDNDIVHQTNAWRSGQVVYLDPTPFYVVMSGLSAVSTMVDQVKDGLS